MSTRMTWMVTGKGMEHITPSSLCHELPDIPPPNDFVVFVDEQGKVYRWLEPVWFIGGESLNFGTQSNKRILHRLNPANADLLKRCVAWFMWGDRRPIAASTLLMYHAWLKPLFATCSHLPVPISASDMGRFFTTIESELAAAIRPSSRAQVIGLLHELWMARDRIGFELLAPEQIARLRELVPDHEAQQHQFIPPRIWAYAAARMQAFLEDFIAHKEQFRALLNECASAYRTNFGSLAMVRTSKAPGRFPFQQSQRKISGCVYLESFPDVARRHGVADVIERWLFDPGTSWENVSAHAAGPQLLGRYFGAIGVVGTAYLQCFSGMRIAEALSLRSNCLSVEHDPLLGNIHILSGETSKTIQDSDARWITASTATLAVEAMSAVSRWRTDIAVELGTIPLTAEDRANPYLVQRAYEPWVNRGPKAHALAPSFRPDNQDISVWDKRVPGLFEAEALRITADDASYVQRFSANADLTKYGEGCIWYFTSHQYRRSIQVYMAASGVSLPARQYQLKHITSAQSGYYSQGHQNLRLNRRFGQELLSVRYELVAVDAALLNGPEYVSPHGEARKSEVLRFFDVSSRDEITKAQKKGQLTVRQTVVGICTARRCEYGGFDNYVHCTHCVDGLMDKRKRGVMEKEGRTIAARLVDVPAGTPLRAALERRLGAVEEFMNVTA